jgi:hypothetical protein
MKRTRKHRYGNPTELNNGTLNRNAFDHALAALAPAKNHITLDPTRRYPMAFDLLVEFEHGRAVTLHVSLHRGVRFTFRDVFPTGHPLHRLCLPRLAKYRKQLIAWQAGSNPFTFRDFNRLLAALSYNPKCPPTAQPSTTHSES